MNRWLGLAISVIGGAVIAYAMLLVVGGAVLGIFWLYVFGDDPWPEWSNYVLGTAIVLGGFAAWIWGARTIWRHLKRR
ncbi:MAG TPA: hypothetical protein VM757_06725 [Sphingomicrobium sp.]|nr:hypothetical protein [Sphingomicrobium sp.]